MTRKILIALVLSAAALPHLAAAQGANPGALSQPGLIKPGGKGGPARDKAPSALPGARAEPTEVAPPTKITADMPPTEALFDAVNRGDLPTAKDAINRGADLTGTNVLGLTPLELAVDLGRNEISFLLLSLRGGAGYTTARAPAGGQEAKPSRAEVLAAQRAEREEKAARQRSARVAPPLPTAPRTAQLFAGNGGAPIPQAGFLGFDATR